MKKKKPLKEGKPITFVRRRARYGVTVTLPIQSRKIF